MLLTLSNTFDSYLIVTPSSQQVVGLGRRVVGPGMYTCGKNVRFYMEIL